MIDLKEKEKFIKCDCHAEGILITKFPDEPEFYVSFWREGFEPVKLTFWMRLKLCYMALVKGQYYEDQVILNEKTAKELADWLNENNDYLPKED